MCEIFVLKKRKGLIFSKSELKSAEFCNSDGAGFVVFDWDKKKSKWEITDFDIFKPRRRYTYHRNDWENMGSYYRQYQPTRIEQHDSGMDAGQDDYDIAMCGKSSMALEEENYESEKEYMRSQLSAKDFLELYPEEKEEEEEEEEEEKEIEDFEETEKGLVRVDSKKEDIEDADTVDAIFERQKRLKDGQMMIAHFRLSTSGHSHDNTQPILNGDYITIHNGIFAYKSEPAGFSDTRHFSELLKNASKKLKRITPKAEQKMIEKLLDDAGGYYSIFVYSFKTGQIYYYKSAQASFHWAYNGLMGSTKAERFPILHHSAQAKEVVRL